jgi:hypothetical protein
MAKFALLVALLTAQPAPAEAPLPPAPEWRGDSERLVARRGDPWITTAEASGFQTTPSYAETRAYIDRLVAAAPRLLRIERFGTSSEGRELYAVIASRGAGRPAVLVQAGIHAGEIDGKDAGLMLLRDIAVGRRGDLLDRADLVLVPIFNPDGHERSSRFSRPNQRGPREQGWRTTARNLNLNRDYLKAEAPEMQAMLAFLRRVDPALYLDIHVTDGTDYQYDITYGFLGWGGRYAQSPAIGRWLDTRLRPAFDGALTRAGHIPGGLVFAVDNRNPAAGIADVPFGGRFSQGYGDLARIPTVLVENHSLKPYRQRVLGTYVLIEEALRLVGREAGAVRTAIAADRGTRPESMILAWRPVQQPAGTIPWHGIAYELAPSPVTGRDEIRWLGRAVSSRMPVFVQEPTVTANLPRAWWVPASRPEVIERLRLHGVAFETLATAQTVEVEMARLREPTLLPASEGRVPLRIGGVTRLTRRETMPAGSVRVPVDQPRALVAAALLEPESPESLLAWGFFPEILQRTEYIEAYAIEPLARRMLAANPALARAFDEALRDPAFAANPDRRLAWFYERSPYYDDRYLLYPIGRELAR